MEEHERKLKAEQEQEKRWKTWKVTAEDYKVFASQFKAADSDGDGFVTGAQAKTLFAGTGLPNDVLGKIWSLSDKNKDQKLDEREYVMAMFLIRCKQKGETLPSAIPELLLYSIYPELAPSRSHSDNEPEKPKHPTLNTSSPLPSLTKEGSTGYDTVPKFELELKRTGGLKESPLVGRKDSPVPTLKFQFPTAVQLQDKDGSFGSNSSRGSAPYGVVTKLQKENRRSSPHPSPYGTPILTNTDSVGSFHSGKSTRSSSASSSGGSLAMLMEFKPPPPSDWVEYKTPEGRSYYYDRTTKKTTWNAPPEFIPAEQDTAAPPPPVKETTQSLLNDPTKVEFFRRFLESEESNHEILFYMDVENFKQSTQSGIIMETDILKAEMIYEKYIKKKKAIYYIELSKPVYQAISKAFKDRANKKPNAIHRDLFNDAEAEMLQRLEKEQLPRFMKSMFYITMYNSMTSRGAYELPEQLWRDFLTAAEGSEEDGWQYVSDAKGVLIYKKQFKGETMMCVRGNGVVPIPPEEMYVFAASIPLRAHWDTLFDFGRIVERLDEKTVIWQQNYKPPKWAPMYKPHEFVMLRTERRLADGSIIVLSRSVVHKDAEETKKYVRDDLECSGFVIRPCGATSSVVIYVNQVAMKGIPKWAEARLVNKRPLLIHKIRKFVEKELKDKKKVPAWRRKDILDSIHADPEPPHK